MANRLPNAKVIWEFTHGRRAENGSGNLDAIYIWDPKEQIQRLTLRSYGVPIAAWGFIGLTSERGILLIEPTRSSVTTQRHINMIAEVIDNDPNHPITLLDADGKAIR